MRRARSAKIVATLGPASFRPSRPSARCSSAASTCSGSTSATARRPTMRARLATIRALEKRIRPADRRAARPAGPEAAPGHLRGRPVAARSRRALPPRPRHATPGDAQRAPLPHPEIFAALQAGTELLLDDGKLRLRVEQPRRGLRRDHACVVGGPAVRPQGRQRAERAAADLAADREGPRRPGLRPRRSASTGSRSPSCSGPRTSTRRARSSAGRAGIMAKLEKPAAIEHLDGIVALSDARHGRARRPRRRAAARAGAATAEAHRARLPQGAASRWSWRRRCSNR